MYVNTQAAAPNPDSNQLVGRGVQPKVPHGTQKGWQTWRPKQEPEQAKGDGKGISQSPLPPGVWTSAQFEDKLARSMIEAITKEVKNATQKIEEYTGLMEQQDFRWDLLKTQREALGNR